MQLALESSVSFPTVFIFFLVVFFFMFVVYMRTSMINTQLRSKVKEYEMQQRTTEYCHTNPELTIECGWEDEVFWLREQIEKLIAGEPIPAGHWATSETESIPNQYKFSLNEDISVDDVEGIVIDRAIGELGGKVYCVKFDEIVDWYDESLLS